MTSFSKRNLEIKTDEGKKFDSSCLKGSASGVIIEEYSHISNLPDVKNIRQESRHTMDEAGII